jgi:hypothetical protein
MLSPQTLWKTLVARSLPMVTQDGPESERTARGGRYGEVYTQPLVRKLHNLADEGSYFTANNAQTAITGQALNAFDATKPSIVIYNSDSAANPLAKRIYIDYIQLVAGGTAYSNGVSNTATYCHIATDNVNRYSSGGTALTVQNVNQDGAIRTTVASAYAGAITTTTASALRTLSGYRLFRLPVSATALSLANVDRWNINFGGVENIVDLQTQISATLEATAVARSIAFSPVVIGPGQSFLFYITPIANSAPVGGTLHYDIGWWER